MRRVYMDHSATTPVHPEVAAVIFEYTLAHFGNASSVHSWGEKAKNALEDARKQVSELIAAQSPDEVLFTSGGTESNNLAIKGAARARSEHRPHIITSAVEHHAVINTCQALENEGFRVTAVGVDGDGRVNVPELKEAICEDTALISIMMANNEVGTVQPLSEIVSIAEKYDVLVHTDSVQAVGQMEVDVEQLGVDMLTISGHKLYGPKGVGALYVREGTDLQPVQHGGNHESNLRAGTENIPGIVGLGKACALASGELRFRIEHMTRLRDRLMEGLQGAVDGIQINGDLHNRLPNNVNISLTGMRRKQEALLTGLSDRGIAASGGTTCTSEINAASHVLESMGISKELAQGSVRLTLGRNTVREDVDYVVEVLPQVVKQVRSS